METTVTGILWRRGRSGRVIDGEWSAGLCASYEEGKMLKHLLGATFVVLSALLLSVWTSGAFVQAAPAKKKDPAAAAEKAAAKDLKRISKATAKAIKARGKAAVREIKRLTKIIKTGKGIEAFQPAGVVGAGKDDVTQAAVCNAWLDVTEMCNQFQVGCVGDIEGANLAACDSDAVEFVTNETRSVAYCGNLVTGFAGDLYAPYVDSYSSVQSAVYAFVDVASDYGVCITYSPCGLKKPVPFTWRCGRYTTETVWDTWSCSDDNRTSFRAYSSNYRDVDYTRYVGTCKSAAGDVVFSYSCDRQPDGTSALCTGDVDSSIPAGTYRYSCEYQVPYYDDFDDDGDEDYYYYDDATDRTYVQFSVRAIDTQDLSMASLMADIYNQISPRYSYYKFEIGGESDQTNLLLDPRLIEDVVDLRAGCSGRFNQTTQETFKTARLDSSRFPTGQGPNGFTIEPEISGPDRDGEMIVVARSFVGDIPLNDPVNSYQYGFVFDQDGIASNNYVPPPAFENDFYGGTDKWYSVEYTPSGGWVLKVTDVRTGSFVAVASAARAVIRDNAIAVVIPTSEFSVRSPAYRTSSFRHSGDFGQNPPFDWSADYEPAPRTPLQPFRDR